jgi:hypothetical protein
MIILQIKIKIDQFFIYHYDLEPDTYIKMCNVCQNPVVMQIVPVNQWNIIN